MIDFIFAIADPATSLAVGIGLSILAGLLLDNDDAIDTDKPTTLSTRGSHAAWLCGRNLIAPVFCWAGERTVNSEKAAGGKGSALAPEQDIYYESGLHLLTWGACDKLLRIAQNGKYIFEAVITPESHPSGSQVDLGREGSFFIYWGEADQPINPYLADDTRLGIESRWPHACYVFWFKKRLGPSPVWPNLQYIVERKPSNTLLTQSSGSYEDEEALTGPTYEIDGAVADPDPDVGYLVLNGDRTDEIFPTRSVELLGNGLADGKYEVHKVETNVTATGNTTPGGFFIEATTTRVHLVGGTAGANDSGTMQLYKTLGNSGVNIAHGIAEALFAEFPLGGAIDPDHTIEKWDLESLEALGVESEADEWRSSLVLTDGETLEDLIGACLQEYSMALTFDNSGALTFKRVREPSGTLPNFQPEVYGGRLPEIVTDRGAKSRDRIVFTFRESTAGNYGKRDITVDNDASSRYEEIAKAQEVTISTTVHYETAAAIANLREPEELSDHSEFKLDLSREARSLIPGDAFTADDFDEVLRVMDVTVDPDSEIVEVTCIVDAFGVPKSTFVPADGGGIVDRVEPGQDEFAWIEVPEQLLGVFPQTMIVAVPRIRSNSSVYFTTIHLSEDGSTYVIDQNTRGVCAGGVLTSALDADGPTFVEQGPEYTEEGPDNGDIQDLSASLTNWGLGRQLAIIVSTEAVEICFLQKATVTGADTRRLDGLLRARYDTRKASHPVGARVYICDFDALDPVLDPLLVPGGDLYVKSQPGSTAGQVNLSAVPAYADTLYGKGQKPIAGDYVYVRAPFLNVPVFQTGGDVTLDWAISTGTTATGAGAQAAGTAIGPPEIPGSIQLLFYTAGDSLVGNVTLDGNDEQYVLENAELVSLFGSEPTSFRVRVRHSANGQASTLSDPLTITRI